MGHFAARPTTAVGPQCSKSCTGESVFTRASCRLRNLFALGVRSSNEAVFGEWAILADHLIVDEEFDIFFEARKHAKMRLLHVEEPRPGREFSGSNRCSRRLHPTYGRNFQFVSIVLVE